MSAAAPSGSVQELKARISGWSRAGCIDRDGWIYLAECGLIGVSVRQAPARGLFHAARHLAAGRDLGILASFLINEITLRLVTLLLDEPRTVLLERILAGKDNVALCITEPEAGSDLQGLQTTAKEQGDGWVLDGKKVLISNGPIADHFVVAGRTGPPTRSALRGVTLFLVQRGTPGAEPSGPLAKAGVANLPVGELVLSGCALPKAATLGAPNRGMQYLMETLQFERLAIAMGALVAAETCLQRFVPYLGERAVFGRNLAAFDSVKDWLGAIRAKLCATEALVEALVDDFDRQIVDGSRIIAAKVGATEVLEATALLIQKLSGGRGFMADHWAANLLDEVRWMCIAGGANEVLRGVLGNELAHARAREPADDRPQRARTEVPAA